MENQPNEEGKLSETVEELLLQLTPEQESELLVEEFDESAKSLELAIPDIPEDKSGVKDKVVALNAALRSFTTSEMLVLFHAMDVAHKKLVSPCSTEGEE